MNLGVIDNLFDFLQRPDSVNTISWSLSLRVLFVGFEPWGRCSFSFLNSSSGGFCPPSFFYCSYLSCLCSHPPQFLLRSSTRFFEPMDLLRRVWSKWQKLVKLIANRVGRFLLGIYYFTVLAPFGFILYFLGDLLSIKRNNKPCWVNCTPGDRNLDETRRQF